MAYSAEISRSAPTALLFVVDQSSSMGDEMSSGRSKAQFVADALNRTLATLIVRCTKAEGTRDYFEIGVLGYGSWGVQNGFAGSLGGSVLQPISKIEAAPLRVEDRRRKTDDGAGGVVEQHIKFPVWFDPRSDGGTPMRAALTHAAKDLVTWCDAHPSSYPPTVIHVTDGESTDGSPEELALALRQIQTDDGAILLFNLHVSSTSAEPVKFPSTDIALVDAYAKLLFRMSSVLPAHLARAAEEKGFAVSQECRGFVFNAEAPEIAEFFDIGTRASQLR